MAQDGDWGRLAEYVLERRIELDLTQAEVQAAGGPSPAVQRQIEGALSQSYQRRVLAALERALRWERGSVRAVLAGGEAIPMPEPEPGDPPGIRAVTQDASLPYEVRMEMARVGRKMLAERESSRA
jgi:hypothetical protein